MAGLQDSLGALDQFSGLQPVAEVGDFTFECGQLLEPAHRDLDRRYQVADRERLDQVGHRAGVTGLLDQVALAERGQHDDRCDALGGDLGRGVDTVAPGHLDVQDHQVRSQALGQVDRFLAVAGLPDHEVALLAQHLGQVEPDQRLVLGDEDPPGRITVRVGHGLNCVPARGERPPGSTGRADPLS